jgi:hypothetical protein
MVNTDDGKETVNAMARDKSTDDVWDAIFDSLVIDNEPPFEYIKNAVITTKAGARLKVSAMDFAHILERERYLSSEESNILSCRLAINFSKVRKDVDSWAAQLIKRFEPKLTRPKASTVKKNAAKRAPVAPEARKPIKRSTPGSKQTPKD